MAEPTASPQIENEDKKETKSASEHGHNIAGSSKVSDTKIDEITANFLLNGANSVKEVPKMTHGGWLLAFTRFHRIPVFKRVWLYLLIMALYTAAVDQFLDRTLPNSVLKEAGAAAYSSVVLGLLLVFRTNTAYERWNDGRKLWGQLVNDSRNICFKVKAFTAVPEMDKILFGQLVISFAYALKHHLRQSTPSEPLPGLGPNLARTKHLPINVTTKIFDMLQSWKQAGYIDSLTLLQLDYHIRAFMDICGGCERIKNSPIAVSYRAFMRQGIVLNLLVIPWFLAPEFSLLWCLPLILMGTYFLIGLELIAEDIEDPFGYDGDDLPLDTICGTIRTTVSEIIGLHRHLKFTQSIERPAVDPLKT